MGLFSEMKAMASITKDIIKTGKETFKACEAMDALIERAKRVSGISAESEAAINALSAARENTSADNKEQIIEEAQVHCLEVFQKDSRFSVVFKDECKAAIQNYKDVSNGIIDRLGDTLSSLAENEEQVEEIRKAVNSEKKL